MCLERIRGQWQRAASLDYLTGLLDVDLFKRINDQHGHEVGDRALKHLAARLQATCRKSDLAGRLGGEEFVLLWDEADSAHCLAAAEHLQDDLLRRADLALYSAKAGGRDRVELAA